MYAYWTDTFFGQTCFAGTSLANVVVRMAKPQFYRALEKIQLVSHTLTSGPRTTQTATQPRTPNPPVRETVPTGRAIRSRRHWLEYVLDICQQAGEMWDTNTRTRLGTITTGGRRQKDLERVSSGQSEVEEREEHFATKWNPVFLRLFSQAFNCQYTVKQQHD